MIKQLKICGFKFKVVYKDVVFEGEDKCLGRCLSDDNTIELQTKMTPQRENEVILHESLHAIDEIMTTGLSEIQINTLGVLLTSFIADNKTLIQKIMKEN